MPSVVADDVERSSRLFSDSPTASPKQLSPVDKQPPVTDALPGAWPSGPNGINGSIGEDRTESIPNGRMGSMDGSRDRLSLGRRSIQSLRSKRSTTFDSEKRSLEQPSLLRSSFAADDGYFAPSNGSLTAPHKSPVAKSTGTAAMNNDAISASSIKSGLSLQMSPSSALFPVNEGTAVHNYQTTDGLLGIPPSAHPHRASSPPAFSPSSASQLSSSPTNTHAERNRLVHRHTLEVPRVVPRTSRDGPPEDIAFASGRNADKTPARRRGSSQLNRRATRSIHSDLHFDDFTQDDDAARWAERIKAKRASRRRKDEDDDRVVVGTKVDEAHVNWVTAYNMLTGIRFTVSRTNAKIDRDLTEADFVAKHKFSFDITGNELTPSAKYDFKFKDYAPWVFRHLRTTFRIDPADYLVSLTSKYILSELGSPGKSGSFFYFSRDYKYIIKTIHHAEHKFLRKVLKEYYDHVQTNPNTLLSQFYGLHRVKIPYGRKIHFVVMNNLFPPHRDIHRTFDLKGSTVGRDFKEEDLERNPRATLKDLNWLRRNLHLEFGPTKKEAFVEQMVRDVQLLQRLKIMDYSLLVGIHDMERGNEENLRDKTLRVFQPGGEKEQQPQPNLLMRTASKLENAKKAKELRQLIKTEKPIPMDKTLLKMPDEMLEQHRRDFYFYSDDGGFRATHENDAPGEEIYYLGIIDCLTKYSFIKKAEHFWKGLSAPESQISAVPPDRYGDRFVKFISAVTKTREAAEAEKHQPLSPSAAEDATECAIHAVEGTLDDPKLTGVNLLKGHIHGRSRRGTQDSDKSRGSGGSSRDRDIIGTPEAVMSRAQAQAEKSRRHGANEKEVPDRTIMAAVRTPEAGAGADRGDMITLPVIGEVGENGSQSGSTREMGGSSANTKTSVTPQPSKEVLRGVTDEGLAMMPSHTQSQSLDDGIVFDRSDMPPPPPPPSVSERVPQIKLSKERLDGPLPQPPAPSITDEPGPSHNNPGPSEILTNGVDGAAPAVDGTRQSPPADVATEKDDGIRARQKRDSPRMTPREKRFGFLRLDKDLPLPPPPGTSTPSSVRRDEDHVQQDVHLQQNEHLQQGERLQRNDDFQQGDHVQHKDHIQREVEGESSRLDRNLPSVPTIEGPMDYSPPDPHLQGGSAFKEGTKNEGEGLYLSSEYYAGLLHSDTQTNGLSNSSGREDSDTLPTTIIPGDTTIDRGGDSKMPLGGQTTIGSLDHADATDDVDEMSELRRRIEELGT